ncbi:MAG: putative metal-binding motif-containing protein, partial [Myxococcota bacterium]
MKPFLALLLAGCSDIGVVKHALDADSDGYSDEVDCDEAHATVNPDADEVCDGMDNDCDGAIDEDVTDAGTWFPDADADTFGDPAGAVTGCEAPAGFVSDDTDCDDADAAVSPGSDEVCNLVDDDCDGDVDDADASLVDGETWYADADGDTHGDAGAARIACARPEGFVAAADDCDDTDAAVRPDALEVCDPGDVDEDCDGLSDDEDASVDPAGRATAYPDDDADGFGDATRPVSACDLPASTVADATDCLDTDGAVNPVVVG